MAAILAVEMTPGGGVGYALVVIPAVAATVVGPLSEGLAAVAGQVEVGVPRPLVLGHGSGGLRNGCQS